MRKSYLDLQKKGEDSAMLDNPPVCLTVAGHDPSGGAGIVADIKTFTAFGCFATAAITSLTFQNTSGVFGAVNESAAAVRGQIEPVIQDFEISAVKTGMLPTGEIIEEAARIVKENNLPNLVVDPVVRSTSGFDLIPEAALRVVIEKLFPLAAIVTPNIAEAERISGLRIDSFERMREAARRIHDLGAVTVLVKSGHLIEAGKTRDLWFDGENFEIFSGDYIETNATHGTGCTLAAAIAANLARGENLKDAISIAKKFVTEAIRRAPQTLGHGNPPVNHGFAVRPDSLISDLFE